MGLSENYVPHNGRNATEKRVYLLVTNLSLNMLKSMFRYY